MLSILVLIGGLSVGHPNGAWARPADLEVTKQDGGHGGAEVSEPFGPPFRCCSVILGELRAPHRSSACDDADSDDEGAAMPWSDLLIGFSGGTEVQAVYDSIAGLDRNSVGIWLGEVERPGGIPVFWDYLHAFDTALAPAERDYALLVRSENETTVVDLVNLRERIWERHIQIHDSDSIAGALCEIRLVILDPGAVEHPNPNGPPLIVPSLVSCPQ